MGRAPLKWWGGGAGGVSVVLWSRELTRSGVAFLDQTFPPMFPGNPPGFPGSVTSEPTLTPELSRNPIWISSDGSWLASETAITFLIQKEDSPVEAPHLPCEIFVMGAVIPVTPRAVGTLPE